MPLETESRGLMRRLVVFYVILAAITVGVVIYVVNKGKDEKAQPAIAGVYQSAALNACIGPAPKPVGGAPLPPTAPTQVPGPRADLQRPAVGSVRQLHQQPEHAGRQAPAERDDACQRRPQADRRPSTASTAAASRSTRSPFPGAKASITGTLGGAPFAATFKSDPPAAGAPAPRTPVNLKGTYATSPTSTCLGGKFALSGSAPTYGVSWKGVPLGKVTYSDTTGCSRRRHRLRQGRHGPHHGDRERPQPART